MAVTILILSAILFIATFGIHAIITQNQSWDRPMYTNNPVLSSIPWISGFILPVIPLTIVSGINWIIIFFFNLAAVYLLGPVLTKAFLIRFASGRGLGNDLVISFVAGIVVLTIGLISI